MNTEDKIMKRLFILVFIALLSASVKAQTFAEWFRQKKTQKKYLLQQIAGLQMYNSYAQKGYSIAKDGLNVIGDIKHGELNLHNDYFNSLKTVKPTISKYSKVGDIIALQLKIIKVYRNAYSRVKQSKAFNAGEIQYINQVFSSLINDCAGTIEQLTMAITSNQLQMKDDERLKRIDAIYYDMQDKYTFAQSFAGEAKILAASRLKERNDVQTSRGLNGIKN